MIIKESDLIELGFERVDVPPQESGDEFDWHYYTSTVCQIEFITDTSYEIVNDEWSVEFLNSHPPIKITNLETFKTLYNTLKTIEDGQNTLG